MILCHFRRFLKSVLLFLNVTFEDPWMASRMLLSRFIPLILCNFDGDIPCGSYDMNRIGGLCYLPHHPPPN